MDMSHRSERRTPRLLTIGEFSRLSRLSVRMLRHYDEHDVLVPALVDPSNGYRLYAADQLRDAGRITALRDVGLPVAAIAAILPAYDDAGALAGALRAQRIVLVREANAAAERIGGVDHLLQRLQEDPLSTPSITLTTVPAHTIAFLRDTIPTYHDEGALWERFMAWFPTSGAVYAPTLRCGAMFHDAEYRDADPDVEVWMDVAAPFEAGPVDGPGTAGCRTVPEQQTLKGMLRGDYAGVGDVYEQIGREVAARGLRMAGPSFNVYIVGPGQSTDPAQWVTEVHAPVVPA